MQEEKILVEKVIGGDEFRITSFNICPSYYEYEDHFDKLYREELFERYDQMIKSSIFFLLIKLNKYKEEPELNTNQCRLVFKLAIETLSYKYSFMEIWSTTCEYFNIKPDKFYAHMQKNDKKRLYNLLLKKRQH